MLETPQFAVLFVSGVKSSPFPSSIALISHLYLVVVPSLTTSVPLLLLVYIFALLVWSEKLLLIHHDLAEC